MIIFFWFILTPIIVKRHLCMSLIKQTYIYTKNPERIQQVLISVRIVNKRSVLDIFNIVMQIHYFVIFCEPNISKQPQHGLLFCKKNLSKAAHVGMKQLNLASQAVPLPPPSHWRCSICCCGWSDTVITESAAASGCHRLPHLREQVVRQHISIVLAMFRVFC